MCTYFVGYIQAEAEASSGRQSWSCGLIHRSTAFTIPKGLSIGEETSLAADAIILADPTGRINEADLLEFLETHVEPAFWEWLKQRKENETEGGDAYKD